jgi:serine/threonine protein phosphatase PrpC
VVAVKAPGKPLTVAWCGDSRAYLMERGIAVRLTEDHNKRQSRTAAGPLVTMRQYAVEISLTRPATARELDRARRAECCSRRTPTAPG